MTKANELTREDLLEYRARWERVAELELEEARAAPFKKRWQELNAIFDLAYELGWLDIRDEQEIAAVRERWARLKARYR